MKLQKTTFGSLNVGDLFYKEGYLMKKIEPIKGGGCGCTITANSTLVEENPTPLRLYGDTEEVEIEEENKDE